MGHYRATYQIEFRPRYFQAELEDFHKPDDTSALEYVKERLPAVSAAHKNSPVSLVKLIQIRKVDIKEFSPKVSSRV